MDQGSDETNRSGGSAGGVVAVVGGILVVVGSFLAWASLSAAGTSVSTKGIDGSDGTITLICGIVLLLYGIGRMTGAVKVGVRALAIIALVAGLIAGGLALYDAATAKKRIVDDLSSTVAGKVGVSSDQARRLLQAAVDSGGVQIRLGFGIFLVMGGGLLGLVGGVLAVTSGGPAVPASTASAQTAYRPPSVGVPPPAGSDPPSEPSG
jgi:hypothetical protein